MEEHHQLLVELDPSLDSWLIYCPVFEDGKAIPRLMVSVHSTVRDSLQTKVKVEDGDEIKRVNESFT